MTVEAALTRKLGITFIDARSLATESKLRLNITGYPSPQQKEQLIEEASRIFSAKPNEEQRLMQVSRDVFEQTKIEAGSSSSMRSNGSGIDGSERSSEFFSTSDSVMSSPGVTRFSFVSNR